MSIAKRIEQRVALPGDSETRRSQKTISVILLFFGAIFTFVNVISLLALGLKTPAAILFVMVLSMLTVILLIFAFPRYWLALGSFIILGNIIFALAAHVATGGFQAGLEIAIWMLINITFAALLFGPRLAIFALLFYIVGVITAAFLEPLAQSNAPPLLLSTRMQIASTNLIMMGIFAAGTTIYLVRQVDFFRRRANDLLLNMLPGAIAARLKENPGTIADGYSTASVLFADMVGSTPLFSSLEPTEAVDWLNEVFSMFDTQVQKYNVEKVRTIGDNYMVAAGVPLPREDHAQVLALLALDMLRGLQEIPPRHGNLMNFRVGINSGPLIAGVIGQTKYQYDLWGDTVNIASRMESQGEAGKIHISQATYELLKDEFQCISRGVISIKGKGEMETWFVIAPKT